MTHDDRRLVKAGSFLFGATCALLLAACGPSVAVTSEWKAAKPAVLPYRQVLVVGITPNSRTRRGFEQELSRLLVAGGTRASASIEAGPSSAPPTPETVAAMARSTGADAILVTRLVSRKVALVEDPTRVGVKTQQPASITDGTGLVEFFSLNYNEYEEPGEVSTTSRAVLESSLFEAGDGGRLVYAMKTTAKFKEDRDDVVAAVSSAIAAQLRRDGLVR